MKNILLKITAWMVLIWCSISSLAALSFILLIFIFIKDVNKVKLILVDAGLVIAAGLVFIFGLGVFNFITSFVKIKQQFEEIKEEK